MADKHNASHGDNPVMDYAEHDKTYSMFLAGAKWGTVACVGLMIAMAFGFFAGFGLIGGTIVWAIVIALGIILV